MFGFPDFEHAFVNSEKIGEIHEDIFSTRKQQILIVIASKRQSTVKFLTSCGATALSILVCVGTKRVEPPTGEGLSRSKQNDWR